MQPPSWSGHPGRGGPYVTGARRPLRGVQFTPRNPLPMISVLVVMIMKAPGSSRRT